MACFSCGYGFLSIIFSIHIFIGAPLTYSLLGLTTRDRRDGNLMPRSFVEANAVPCGKFAFQCLICEKVIKYHEKIKRHLRDIHWTAGPSYLCPEDECKKTYTSRHAFAEHKRRKHPQWRGIALDKFIKKKSSLCCIRADEIK